MIGFVEPCDAIVEIIYRCPKCACEHKLTRKDTEYPGIVVCYCKHRFRVRPIEQIKVLRLYRDINRKNFTEKPSINIDDAVTAMVSLGYKKSEITKRFSRLMKNKSYNNVDDLIKSFLMEEKGNG